MQFGTTLIKIGKKKKKKKNSQKATQVKDV